MKKLLTLLFLTLTLTFTLCACSANSTAEDTKDEEAVDREEASITFLFYTWDGWGISTKIVENCTVAYDIIDALKNIKETGEIIPKISDDVLKAGHGQYPIERGTMWIECEGKIYRLDRDSLQLCLVETHFGEGKVLEFPPELKSNINAAWNYAPYDYYIGTYESGNKTVELTRMFEASSSVKMTVKEIHVEKNDEPQNSITFELVSSKDQEIDINLECQQSDDNRAKGDFKKVELKKDEPQTVKLTFGGWPNFRYWIYITVDNTKACIEINP